MSSNDDVQMIAEALTRVQWRHGPAGPRGFGPFPGFGEHGSPGERRVPGERGFGEHGFGGSWHSEEFPFGGRHHPGMGRGGRGRGRALLRLLTSLVRSEERRVGKERVYGGVARRAERRRWSATG